MLKCQLQEMKTLYKVIAFFFFSPKCKTAITDVGISYSKKSNWKKYRNLLPKK